MDGVDVTAEEFGVKGPRGWAFRGVGFRAEAGSLVAVAGASSSGRTSLLLALTGRMKPSAGTAVVGGLALPRRMAAVRKISAVANMAGVTDLEPALTVAEHLRERALLQRRFGESLREALRPHPDRVHEARLRADAALAAAGLDPDTLPKGSRTPVRDLERLEALRLSVALALVGRPGLLAVDDAELRLSDEERAEVWTLLRSVARTGTTVLAVCRTAPEDCVIVSTDAETGTEPEPEDQKAQDTQEAPEPRKEADTDALTPARRA
ncbi:ATP-binding cassette domain-containing protein [Streptomyces sp. LaPpAH-108]|uniref:ATP-binding cassette domain-containing protein n=1 Tax=Streptomyces sp. LaPpAH-108 TaxID=1155714 RepID=UPI00035DE489|nr:ATP-binding cassette domain-containing protein [Streptomyces sp. LaPpAH-108]